MKHAIDANPSFMTEAMRKQISRVARKTPKRIIDQRKPGPATVLIPAPGTMTKVEGSISPF